MSSPASSSRTAVIAGTLAGLLAAALGVHYLQLNPPGAPASTPAAATPGLGGVQGAPARTSEAPAARTREQAVRALMALPELKAWSARIEKRSGGKSHGAVVEYDPAPRIVNGKRYWQLSFVENGADAAERWESFLVSDSDHDILVEDAATDELLSLKRWRAEYHPMERGNESN